MLSESQFGFREGHSTLNALMRVQNIADNISKRAYGKRSYSVLTTLDVKNAFDSISWLAIVGALSSRSIRTLYQWFKAT